jgi:hypothetical protein
MAEPRVERRLAAILAADVAGYSRYMKPVRYDAGKLQGLLGPQQMTSYDAGIGHTLAWITSRD